MLIYLLHISSNPTMVTFLIDLEGLLVYALFAICLFSNFSSYFGHVSSVIVLENCNLLYSVLVVCQQAAKQMTIGDVKTC
jgi:hypothetical protein